MSDEMREALEMVLLFHSGGEWTAAKANTWAVATGHEDATTKVLCDHIRVVLAKAGAEEEGLRATLARIRTLLGVWENFPGGANASRPSWATVAHVLRKTLEGE